MQTLGPLRHSTLHSSACIQGSIALRLNRREMHEDVLSVLTLDKAIALGCVEPLHRTFFFHLPIFPSLFLKNASDFRRAPREKRGCGWTHATPLHEAEKLES